MSMTQTWHCAVTAMLLAARLAVAQVVTPDQARFIADSTFLARVQTQGVAPGTAMLHDSVRLRMAALDSTFDLLIASRDADRAARFATMMNTYWTRYGDYAHSLAQFRRAFALGGPPTRSKAVALNAAAFLAFRQRDQAAARALYEDVLRTGEQIGDSAAIANGHLGIARMAARNGDYAETERQAEAAIRIRDAMGDLRGRITPYHTLAFAYRLQKKYEPAARVYEYTIAMSGLIANAAGVATEMYNLSVVRLHQDDLQSAGRLLRESLTALRTLNSLSQIYLLGGFASLATVRKEPRRAALLWGAMEAGLDRAKLTLDPDDQVEIDTYVPIARSQMKEGEFEAARAEGRKMSLDEAVALVLRIG